METKHATYFELMRAIDGLTFLEQRNDGSVVIGPVGWEQARQTLDRGYVGEACCPDHADLVVACSEFVKAFAGNRASQLGNGVAYRCYMAIRAALAKADGGGSAGVTTKEYGHHPQGTGR